MYCIYHCVVHVCTVCHVLIVCVCVCVCVCVMCVCVCVCERERERERVCVFFFLTKGFCLGPSSNCQLAWCLAKVEKRAAAIELFSTVRQPIPYRQIFKFS